MQILKDNFDVDARRGAVIGGTSATGVDRKGIDIENVISIDNGALRIQPLVDSGWGRACLSYGPFERRPGLVMSVFMLNGHNTSQAEPIPESFRDRLDSWISGSRVFGGRLERLKRLITCGGRIPRVLRQIRVWRRLSSREVNRLDENLAVGWFSAEVVDPIQSGAAFVMHATGHECGELWVRAQRELIPVVSSMQNLQVYYVVALRETDAVYYVSSVPGASSSSPYPALRPVGISTGCDSQSVWASVHQSMLGQIGFRLDTRVYGVTVASDSIWEHRYGGAHFADGLRGAGSVGGAAPDVGAKWQVRAGHVERTVTGATSADDGSVSVSPSQCSGLIKCRIRLEKENGGSVAIRWREQDAESCFAIELSCSSARLLVTQQGESHIMGVADRTLPGEIELQILDSGRSIGVYANGSQLFDRISNEKRLSDAKGIGFSLHGAPGAAEISDFEAHPRSIGLPGHLDHGEPWTRTGTQILVRDEFIGEPGDLEGSMTTVGEKRWRKLFGGGEFRRDGKGAVTVIGSREQPCPGRNMYGVDWDNEEFVDVEVTITPPGTARGQRQNGISGIVVWQDDDNYMTVNSWVSDGYDGASISCFFNIRGWEDVYDAIWSNVGSRIQHGVSYKMRVIADSRQYAVHVNGEPVVYRAFRDVYSDCEPLKIRSVGLITNWEWGLDTGSVFRNFCVRA